MGGSVIPSDVEQFRIITKLSCMNIAPFCCLTTCGWSMGTMWPAASTATKVIPLHSWPALQPDSSVTSLQSWSSQMQTARKHRQTGMVDWMLDALQPVDETTNISVYSIFTCTQRWTIPSHSTWWSWLTPSSPPRYQQDATTFPRSSTVAFAFWNSFILSVSLAAAKHSNKELWVNILHL